MNVVAQDYDVIVIGAGPAGEAAAVQSAELGKRVAVIDAKFPNAAVCLELGTIPSKTMREAVRTLVRRKELVSFQQNPQRWMGELRTQISEVCREDFEARVKLFERLGIEVIPGWATFTSPSEICVRLVDQGQERIVTAPVTVIATGTTVSVDDRIPVDGQKVITFDQLLHLDQLPKRIVVIGGGVVGVEYGSLLSLMGIDVTLVHRRSKLLPFLDAELGKTLTYALQRYGMRLILSTEVIGTQSTGNSVVVRLSNDQSIETDLVMYSAGRFGAVEKLNLDQIGVDVSERGLIRVDKQWRTTQAGIFAAGDVTGYPNLASVSQAEGRQAGLIASNVELPAQNIPIPFALYGFPEVASVGKTEEELREQGQAYAVGIARYREVARGKISREQIEVDSVGFLKILVNPADMGILGVHICGDNASELIHIGQAVMAFGGKATYFLDAVLNYPTMSELYRKATVNCLNRLKE